MKGPETLRVRRWAMSEMTWMVFLEMRREKIAVSQMRAQLSV